MQKNKLAYVFVSIAALLWGSTAPVGKILVTNLSCMQVLLFTSFFATLSLFIIAVFQKKIEVIKRFTLRDYGTFAYMGFLGTFLYSFLLYTALSLLSAQEAAIINYLWPIMVIIFATIILKEKFTLRNITGTFLSFAGVFILITKGDFLNLKFGNIPGVLAAFTAAVSYGLFSALGKKHDYEKFTSVMFYYLFAFIYALGFTLIFYKIQPVTHSQLALLIWYGVFANGIAYVFWFLSIQYGDTWEMSNIVLITPFLSLVFIWIILGEKILASSVMGLAVIIAGIIIQSVNGSDKPFLQEQPGPRP